MEGVEKLLKGSVEEMEKLLSAKPESTEGHGWTA